MASEKRRRARRHAFRRSLPDRWPLQGLHLWSPRRGLILLAGSPEALHVLSSRVRQVEQRGGTVRLPCTRPETMGPAGLPSGFPLEPLPVAQVESRSGFRFRWFRALDLGPGETSLRVAGEEVTVRLSPDRFAPVLEAIEGATFPMFSYVTLVYAPGEATLALAGDWLGIE